MTDRPPAGRKRGVRSAPQLYAMPDQVQAALAMANLVLRFWHELDLSDVGTNLRCRGAEALAWCENPDGDCPVSDGEQLHLLVEWQLAHERVQQASVGYTAATIDIANSIRAHRRPVLDNAHFPDPSHG